MRILAAIFLLTISCSNAATPVAAKKTTLEGDATGEKTSLGNPVLSLSWTIDKGVNAYHVYYQAPSKKTLEIDSLQLGDADFSQGRLTIDDSNMEAWPKAGEKACFYIVAELNTQLSEPSDKACILL